jgi:hypothetical protein
VDEQPEVIRSRIDQTRAQLGQKLEILEERVAAVWQTTGAIVSQTIDSVRGAARTVSESLDLRFQVRRHPWLAISGAIAAGYLTERLLTPSTPRVAAQNPPVTPRSAPSPSDAHGGQIGPPFDDRPGPVARSLMLLAGLAREIAVRSYPAVLDQLIGSPLAPPGTQNSSANPQPAPSPNASSPYFKKPSTNHGSFARRHIM